MHTLTINAFQIDQSQIVEGLNKLPPHDAHGTERLQDNTGDIEEFKRQPADRMDAAEFKESDKP